MRFKFTHVRKTYHHNNKEVGNLCRGKKIDEIKAEKDMQQR